MAERRFYWLKLKKDFYADPKIKKLRRIAGGDTYCTIYLKMMLYSIETDGLLTYEGIEPTFEEEVALKLDEDIENTKVTCNYLLANNMMFDLGDNIFSLPEAIKAIGSEGISAERVRKFREKNNPEALQCNNNVTQLKQQSNVEKEIDKDIDKDNNINVQECTTSKKKFVKPTFEEVKSYIEENNYCVDSEEWFNYYESNGWKVGRNPMKDWKACIRRWNSQIMHKTITKPNVVKQVKEVPDWYGKEIKEKSNEINNQNNFKDIDEFFKK